MVTVQPDLRVVAKGSAEASRRERLPISLITWTGAGVAAGGEVDAGRLLAEGGGVDRHDEAAATLRPLADEQLGLGPARLGLHPEHGDQELGQLLVGLGREVRQLGLHGGAEAGR